MKYPLLLLFLINVLVGIGQKPSHLRNPNDSLKNEAFIEAAKGMGFSLPRILFKHISPNLGGPLLVVAAANFAAAILIEAGLGYLGLGIAPPAPSCRPSARRPGQR